MSSYLPGSKHMPLLSSGMCLVGVDMRLSGVGAWLVNVQPDNGPAL